MRGQKCMGSLCRGFRCEFKAQGLSAKLESTIDSRECRMWATVGFGFTYCDYNRVSGFGFRIYQVDVRREAGLS